ncbi:uncharacterized protein [Typha latifolia]|uniref:uncharacterized protein n=1 Tax=Typha latifolia TaxID=4733 RepID=UPI003C308C52
MQRQSIGSPSSKPQINSGGGGGGAAEEKEIKEEKPTGSSSRRTERSIHLIPLLTLLCFLLLYLFSHEPSPDDLASFGGSARTFDSQVVSVSGIGRHEGGIDSALQGNRGLMEARRLRHRKLGRL